MREMPLSTHRYPSRSLWADYARAGTGLILTAGPLFLGDIFITLRIILIVLVFVFFFFGLRAFVRRAQMIELSGQGICARGPFAKTIAWADLQDLRLNFYSTRRDHETGWMQLHLTGASNQIQLDGSIEGFDWIVRQAVKAAQERNISLGASTVENLIALGIERQSISLGLSSESASGL